MIGAPEADTRLSDPDCLAATLRLLNSVLNHFDRAGTDLLEFGAASPASHGGE
jgi:hypothetical protein